MRKFFQIAVSLLIMSILMPSLFSQDLTETQKSSLKYRTKNLKGEKKKPFDKIRRGGMPTFPQGIEGKKINFGFTLGGDIALMTALSEEKCPLGGNVSLYMHGILEHTNTIALGSEIKGFYLLSNKANYLEKYKITGSDLPDPEVKVGDWIIGAVQFSLLGNFNPRPRFNVQLKANIGPLVAVVPTNEANYQIKQRQNDGTYSITTYDYAYEAPIEKTLSLGAAFTIGADVLYALSKNVEFKAGVDWSYLRFTYDKSWSKKVVYETHTVEDAYVSRELAQFGVFDIHFGFSFSF